ncbi:MAG: gcvH [Paenibacillaceae bacterium]|nr:gcvH [Paenibacillaceae bacterium]
MVNGQNLSGLPSWLWMKRADAGIAVIGLTEAALDACGLILHVELPEEGDHILQGHECLLLELLSQEIELPAPLSGKIIRVNRQVERNPGLLHQLPAGQSWLLEVQEAPLQQFE